MSYNASIPANSDSPSIFPAQSQANFTRLQTLIGADHQFNLSATANDGYHNLVRLTQQAPSGVLADVVRLYGKSSAGRIHGFLMDDQGSEYQISPTMPIRAAVNFDGTGAVGANQTIRSSYNVTTVFKDVTGGYTITFTTAMPDANYIVMATGMRSALGDVCTGFVKGDTVYANSVTTTTVKIGFAGQTDTLRDVRMGNIVIMSAT